MGGRSNRQGPVDRAGAGAIVPAMDFLGYQDGVLCMEGVPMPGLAERLGTPFFLISEARLRANYQALERGLAGAVLR